MSQVTTGATLLSADVHFPEVHELPRDEGAFRPRRYELKGMSTGSTSRHASTIGRPPQSGPVSQLFALLSFILCKSRLYQPLQETRG